MTNWAAAGSQQKTGLDVELGLSPRGVLGVETRLLTRAGATKKSKGGLDKQSWKTQRRSGEQQKGSHTIGLLAGFPCITAQYLLTRSAFGMDVYVLPVLLMGSLVVCGSKREHFLENPWQHWQFCMSCPWSPSGVKAFTGDTFTPLRHGHDIPEGCPRAVKLLHTLQPLLSFLFSCASALNLCDAPSYHVRCQLQVVLESHIWSALLLFFSLSSLKKKKGDSVVSLAWGLSQFIILRFDVGCASPWYWQECVRVHARACWGG